MPDKPERYVQVIPSELVAHAPRVPTAQNCDPVQTIDSASFVPKDVLDKLERYVQVTPSVLVAHAPLAPTAQNCDPVQTIDCALFVPKDVLLNPD